MRPEDLRGRPGPLERLRAIAEALDRIVAANHTSSLAEPTLYHLTPAEMRRLWALADGRL